MNRQTLALFFLAALIYPSLMQSVLHQIHIGDLTTLLEYFYSRLVGTNGPYTLLA